MGQSGITGLAHIGIFVKDMDRSIDFYKRLGFSLDAEEITGVRLAFLSAGTCLIELIEPKDAAARSSGAIDHVAMAVDDIEAAVSRANSNGISVDAAKIGSSPILGGIRNVFFTGPDGESLEFFEFSK